jgi:hypothetical protein
MVFTVDRNLFRKGIKKVIQVFLSRATPWYEYVLGVDGMVHKMECNVTIDEEKVESRSVCKEVEKKKVFDLKAILIINARKDVVTVVTPD